jgi:hypothetical protein
VPVPRGAGPVPVTAGELGAQATRSQAGTRSAETKPDRATIAAL